MRLSMCVWFLDTHRSDCGRVFQWLQNPQMATIDYFRKCYHRKSLSRSHLVSEKIKHESLQTFNWQNPS